MDGAAGSGVAKPQPQRVIPMRRGQLNFEEKQKMIALMSRKRKERMLLPRLPQPSPSDSSSPVATPSSKPPPPSPHTNLTFQKRKRPDTTMQKEPNSRKPKNNNSNQNEVERDLTLAIPQRHKQPESIWNSDMHLYIHGRVTKALQVFAEIACYPVHPALLDSNNLDWFLYSDEPAISPSPLALNLAMAICTGARSMGDGTLERQFHGTAREQAGALLDETDFHVATGLMMLGSYSFWSTNSPERGHYYATLGITMCEQLGETNNFVYVRLLNQAYISPTSTHEQFFTFCRKLEALRCAGPSHLFRENISKRLAPSPSLLDEHDDNDNNSISNISDAKRQITTTTTTTSITSIHNNTNTNNNIHRLSSMTVEASLDYILQEISADTAILIGKTAADPTNKDLMQRLSAHMDEVLVKWEKLRPAVKRSQVLMFDLAFASLSTRIAVATGRMADARQSALRFLELANNPLFPHLPVSSVVSGSIALPVLRFFKETDSKACLKLLVKGLLALNNGTIFTGNLAQYLTAIEN